MTNTEFQKHLQEIYDSHDILGKRSVKTVNELFHMLREDNSVTDYNVNLITEDGRVLCVPSVKECFVPVHDLAMHVKEVECEEEDYGFDGLCLNVYTQGEEWFGAVRWCEDDIRTALDDKGYPVTENNIEKLYSICKTHWFTDHMIEAGWEYMHNNIGYGDGWDKSYE